jgi:CheY-like chemotaxis protein
MNAAFSPADIRQGSPTILLVEDEDSVRLVVQKILSSRGYTV